MKYLFGRGKEEEAHSANADFYKERTGQVALAHPASTPLYAAVNYPLGQDYLASATLSLQSA